MAKIKKTNNDNIDRDSGQWGPADTAGGVVNCYDHFGQLFSGTC